MPNRQSITIYVGLILVLAASNAAVAFLPSGDFGVTMETPFSPITVALINGLTGLILYGGLGFLGLVLAKRRGFAELWSPAASLRNRVLMPAILGLTMGVFFIAADSFFRRFHDLGAIPHPPFPTSIFASVSAGIGEEIMFRLFFVAFWCWLVGEVILKDRGKEAVFWVVAVLSALVFAIGHLPSAMFILGITNPAEFPAVLWVEMILLNGSLGLLAAWALRRHGFLAAVGIHFWTDVAWHVIWGAITGSA